jgi:hypothetical protein
VKTGIERIDYETYHRYKIDGRWALGVTTALKGVPKDEVLKRWAARLVADYAINNMEQVRTLVAETGADHARHYLADLPNQRFKTAGIRGTDVHALAGPYIRHEDVEVPEHLYPYVDGYAMYVEDWRPKSLHEELTVASREHNIAGTLDSISVIPGRGKCLVDYKTSNYVYGEHALQVAAYRHMEVYLDDEGKEHPMIPVDECLILHIKPHDYQLIPVQADKEAFQKFLKARDNYVANVQSNKLDKLLGVPIDPPGRAA